MLNSGEKKHEIGRYPLWPIGCGLLRLRTNLLRCVITFAAAGLFAIVSCSIAGAGERPVNLQIFEPGSLFAYATASPRSTPESIGGASLSAAVESTVRT